MNLLNLLVQRRRPVRGGRTDTNRRTRRRRNSNKK